MNALRAMCSGPRVLVRRAGARHPDQGHQTDPDGRCVVYWMQRAQRALDNDALDTAIRAANELKLPVVVYFGLHPGYPGANVRHFTFLAQGIPETARSVRRRGAAFVLRRPPGNDLIRFCEQVRPALVVGDENPLRVPERWRERAARRLRAPLWTVDADVIVPSALFPKEEYAARTLRPRMRACLDQFLVRSPNPRARVAWPKGMEPVSEPAEEAREILRGLRLDRGAEAVTGFEGGTSQGLARLRTFVALRLKSYDKSRNLPHLDGTSELSPWLHFGQLGPRTVALAVLEAHAPAAARDAFLEELIVRRELAVNYVVRNPKYDQLAGCPRWAVETLEQRAGDTRPYLYTGARLEASATHDPIWNAAQTEMVATGRMHGYLRMYWAKKILEWTRDPEEAFHIAVRLNDRYQLDGRDPNGYTGVAWAIGGRHDRPWGPRRKIFGLIRYMGAAGLARKLDVQAYIRRVAEKSAMASPA